MKTLVITTDLSEESEKAFGPGKELARAIGARIRLVSVIENQAAFVAAAPVEVPVIVDPKIFEEMKSKAAEELEKYKAKYFDDIDCEVVVREAKGVVEQ